MSGGVPELLEASRVREKRQTLFYRGLAAKAEENGRSADVERLNELHADEQHHLSRLTARLLELGQAPADLRGIEAPSSPLEGWEEEARRREGEEIRWYEGALADGAGGAALDPRTREILEEIVASERHHHDEAGGKWMSA